MLLFLQQLSVKIQYYYCEKIIHGIFYDNLKYCGRTLHIDLTGLLLTIVETIVEKIFNITEKSHKRFFYYRKGNKIRL